MTAWRVQAVRLPDGDDMDAGIDPDGRWTPTPAADAEPLPGRHVLPGMVDAHCHLSVGEGPDGMPVGIGADAARANLAKTNADGVTVVRDVGSPDSVTLALLSGPDRGELFACGRFLAPPGRYYPALHVPVPVDELVDAALAEVARGARWIKLVGDFPIVRPAGEWLPPEPTYPLDAVERLVAAVHAVGVRVAAHTTTPHVTGLIAAGVDSVEHGPELTDADLESLAARGGAWTPTLCATIGDGPRQDGSDRDADRRRRHAELRERLGHLLPRAVDLGVTVMTGTDVVGSLPREVALLVELGMAPADALAAASTNARRFLGLDSLAPGDPADLVTYEQDPRADPAVLASPTAVVRRGTRVR
jgi:imidazolonepropionase-like amidohydrolase